MIRFPASLSPEEFLRQYWQKSRLFMPQALPQAFPELSAAELGWLATLDDVESRLVFSEQQNGAMRYRVEHGPFDEERLAALPKEYWTLLVQDVEKHLPVFRRLLEEASFIPDWRIDDLMVSFAARGGSVGPHRDSYDVFLCQGEGRREWRIAPAEAALTTVATDELSLVEPFGDDEPVQACRRDVLYLPPGIAHWGIAREPCMTYSIGMRAPTLAEFVTAASRGLDADMESRDDEALFYRDPDLVISESAPGLISDLAIERVCRAFPMAANMNRDEAAGVFGRVVTGVKAWLAPERATRAEYAEFLASGEPEIRVHGMARLAWFAGSRRNFVFANGFARSSPAPELDRIRDICATRTAGREDSELYFWLAAHGAFELQPDGGDDAT